MTSSAIAVPFIETPDSIHGRLLEAVHISGYTMERACTELEWLLEDDRWQKVGKGYERIDDYLETIDLSEFKISIEQRQKLSRRLNALRATQRAAAKALGVTQPTVHRDLELDTNVSKRNSAPAQTLDISNDVDTNVSNPSSIALNGTQVAAAARVKAEKTEKENKKKEEKEEGDRQAAASAVEVIKTDDDCNVRFQDFRDGAETIPDNSVALIFTDPPYDRNSVPMFSDLAKLAGRVLVDGGSLVTFCGQYVLPEVMNSLSSHLRYFWICCCQHTGNFAQMREYGIKVAWKPLLWFVKGTFRRDRETWVTDLIASNKEKFAHDWQQSEIEASYFIETLTLPGEIVLDPFCGGGTTSVAAKKLNRHWLTFDIDPVAVRKTQERLQAV
jgi:hypothetical protein